MKRFWKNIGVTSLLIVANSICLSGQTKPEPKPEPKPEAKPEAAPPTPTRPLQVSEMDGGSVSTAEYGAVLNKDTSLHRKWYVLNDRTCPLQLSEAGVAPAGAGAFLLKGDATTSADISAFDVVAVLFDLWGDHMMNLRMAKVKDLSSNTTFSLSDSETRWPADPNAIKEYLTGVTFVRRVRMVDGKIWLADTAAVLHQLADLKLKVSREELEARPSPR